MEIVKNKILVLEGGFNEEHEISLKTSIEIQKSLRRLGFNYKVHLVSPESFREEIKEYSKEYLFFNALHGTFGEDGKVQKILDDHQFNYTHSKSLSSSIAFDKDLTKKKLKNTDIPILESITLHIDEITINKFKKILNNFGSFVLKPISSGSSYGVKIIKSINDINCLFLDYNKLTGLYANHKILMCEKYINGRELTTTVFDGKNKAEAVAVTEIISKNNFFDYEAKYTKNKSNHVLPAKISKEIYDTCLNYAKKAHEVIGCRGLSRSDFILDKNKIFFLEINSQPGLTPMSLVPEQLSYKNIDFDSMIMNIIKCSL